MKLNLFYAALCMICIAASGYSEERVLMRPLITDETTVKGLEFWLTKKIPFSTRAKILDIYDKDPFNRGAEYDVYKYSYITCELDMMFINKTGFDVAFKDPYQTVVAFKFVESEGRVKVMQGNIGLSATFPNLGKVMTYPSAYIIIFQNMDLNKFESYKDAAIAVNKGFCDLPNIDRVEPAHILGEIMLSNEYKWRPFSNLVYVKSTH